MRGGTSIKLLTFFLGMIHNDRMLFKKNIDTLMQATWVSVIVNKYSARERFPSCIFINCTFLFSPHLLLMYHKFMTLFYQYTMSTFWYNTGEVTIHNPNIKLSF